MFKAAKHIILHRGLILELGCKHFLSTSKALVLGRHEAHVFNWWIHWLYIYILISAGLAKWWQVLRHLRYIGKATERPLHGGQLFLWRLLVNLSEKPLTGSSHDRLIYRLLLLNEVLWHSKLRFIWRCNIISLSLSKGCTQTCSAFTSNAHIRPKSEEWIST